jgi:hypothetical protein
MYEIFIFCRGGSRRLDQPRILVLQVPGDLKGRQVNYIFFFLEREANLWWGRVEKICWGKKKKP